MHHGKPLVTVVEKRNAGAVTLLFPKSDPRAMDLDMWPSQSLELCTHNPREMWGSSRHYLIRPAGPRYFYVELLLNTQIL